MKITHDRATSWYFHLKFVTRVKCPCCKKQDIVINALVGDDEYWNAAHIIHKFRQGSDMVENVRPTCVPCNIADENFKTSYDYMVSIGTMFIEEKRREIKRLHNLSVRYRLKPEEKNCINCLKNTRVPFTEKCGNCGSVSVTALLEDFVEREIEAGRLKDRVKEKGYDEDFVVSDGKGKDPYIAPKKHNTRNASKKDQEERKALEEKMRRAKMSSENNNSNNDTIINQASLGSENEEVTETDDSDTDSYQEENINNGNNNIEANNTAVNDIDTTIIELVKISSKLKSLIRSVKDNIGKRDTLNCLEAISEQVDSLIS